MMLSQIVTENYPLRTDLLMHIAQSGALDEIPSNAVRHHVYYHGRHLRNACNILRQPMLFTVYQTGRHGPQNGFRLCLIQPGFYIDSSTKSEGDLEDDIDRLEEEVPQGHVEVDILG